ncbi:eukaryotic translation initiation factor 2B delta subunit [Pisolithus marmoratus]|nr:eukaryotic translation initiation factor 2B delta subunit [Pisolithus marmoratus]
MSTTTATMTQTASTQRPRSSSNVWQTPNPNPDGGPKSQKQMSKAERRELQERQRAAKAAAKASGPSTPAAKSSATPTGAAAKATTQSPASAAKKSGKTADGKPVKGEPEDTSHVQVDDTTRGLRIFSHFGLPKSPSVTKGDVHPAIIRIGLQFSDFKITGANARCIAMLTAFKAVIQDYVTPPNNTLSRHLMTHLSPQINHLVLARPMSVTMGNAVRQLKLEISGSDIDLPEQDAKNALCTKIDNYIRDRIVIADQVIQETAGKKIKDGDVILTYARSSVVEKVLLRAWEDGKRFSVIIVDSRPMLEGKALLKALTAASIHCTYLLLPSLPSVLPHATTLFVGAHSIHANGAVFSRAGTATVAMMAKMHNVPVVVCCETYKWSETVRWDSFSKNELAPAPFPSSASLNCRSSRHNPDIQTNHHLSVLCPLYDLTPPSYITAVVTEVGVIPPSSMSSIPAALGRTIGA